MNETQQLEQYLQNTLEPEDKLLMDARYIIDADLRDALFWQQETYAMIRHYGRKKLRAEIEAIQDLVFSDNKFTRFRDRVKKIFK